ncbi:MAG: diaminopimelate epimerase [Selenomonas sp.]|uniref:diaminopimelate epimerase n=1 Tax=Selenomonas sp. AE3005 TaxID=1485543 RepID=UPI0004857148|nr:diaminopimelate epimerase [Selenomonas sp. AE3005]MBQ1417066.1 diaminopimelate epimerase [Selenomonas sp.]MBQ1462309.1 diaminopimelate epimerase [Selenomonas sp.]MBQ1615310.1 diaminopimelate epimerase [Selenomonas sp.]MBQ1920196.1 diaminopimelate epimerase [Selenomonas sp.]MBQ2087533.1 diaminopimelate epimerase [Selenomonas sp.]
MKEFTKWQGCGNDFVLFDCRQDVPADYAKLAQQVCDRHYGVGADGILVVLPSDCADFRMRIFNTDGSEAEMCGNGIRCFARYIYDFGLTDKTCFTVETGAGVLVPEIILENGQVTGVKVDMGEPHLLGEEIPVTGFDGQRVIDEPLTVDGKTYRMTAVSMGNPHCVIFVDDAENFPIYELGRQFESHALFPKKTNTEFVEVKDRRHVRMRVWERGAAVTLACGTGSCATVVAGILNDKLDREAEVQLDGGRLIVKWAENNHVFMTGPAELVFSGKLTDCEVR